MRWPFHYGVTANFRFEVKVCDILFGILWVVIGRYYLELRLFIFNTPRYFCIFNMFVRLLSLDLVLHDGRPYVYKMCVSDKRCKHLVYPKIYRKFKSFVIELTLIWPKKSFVFRITLHESLSHEFDGLTRITYYWMLLHDGRNERGLMVKEFEMCTYIWKGQT